MGRTFQGLSASVYGLTSALTLFTVSSVVKFLIMQPPSWVSACIMAAGSERSIRWMDGCLTAISFDVDGR